VPKDTPAAIIDILNREVNEGLVNPAIKARIGDLGGSVLVVSPGEFTKLIIDETDKWAKVIRAANLRPE
jgi:tripartite-type tricarboxylate transporter receptor subunit TctC